MVFLAVALVALLPRKEGWGESDVTRAYYNEFDPGAAAWLRELIAAGLIADGDVDERSILDVRSSELSGYTQCHFFAGIGGWSLSLRLAGWPDDRPVWTGSPPCQPFSAAGKQLGKDDPRHLAPHFISLVRACRPGVLFGEQVASSDVFGKAPKRARGNFVAPPQWAWLDDLSDRLEAARYAVGAIDFPSAGVGTPHIRQRTFFGAIDLERLADADSIKRQERLSGLGKGCGTEGGWEAVEPTGLCLSGGLVNSISAGLEGHGGNGDGSREPGWVDQDAVGSAAEASAVGGMALANSWQRDRLANGEGCRWEQRQQPQDGGAGAGGSYLRTGPLHGFWADADWLLCRDGKWRPVESSVIGMADGVPAELVRSGAYVPASYPLAKSCKESRRVMRLRGYGNAINPWAAKEFIEAFDRSASEVMAAV